MLNLQLAIQLGEAIAAMYRGDLPPTNGANETDTQYRLEEWKPGQFTLIFPGTASQRDWRTDAQILKTGWDENSMVHRGFAAAYRSVGAEILSELLDKRAESVVIAGHSLGGALATLAVEVIADAGCDIAGVYTFGSPRVGNGAFARSYNEDMADVTFRIVNARDPVPWLPFPLPVRTGLYTHVGQRVYLTHDGELEFEPILPHIADAIATVSGQSHEQQFFGDILTARCHQMTAYLGKLKGLTA